MMIVSFEFKNKKVWFPSQIGWVLAMFILINLAKWQGMNSLIASPSSLGSSISFGG